VAGGRCPDIRFIFSHGGGTVSMLISRLAANGLKPEEREKLFRTALAPN
jgi:hypothetical protein